MMHVAYKNCLQQHWSTIELCDKQPMIMDGGKLRICAPRVSLCSIKSHNLSRAVIGMNVGGMESVLE